MYLVIQEAGSSEHYASTFKEKSEAENYRRELAMIGCTSSEPVFFSNTTWNRLAEQDQVNLLELLESVLDLDYSYPEGTQ